MSSTDIDNLINLVGLLITKQDTNMREAISVSDRVLVTLRYLATGDSYVSLSYLFRISKSTISGIVYEVCQTIAIGLKDYLKVRDIKLRKV
ncbi:hypothetical protein NQ318_006000 [Aromia moschata]|uniref:Transposase Helix-turn-helix domain-containing protein n=1 Tax=Aromia moschata TaxID=1265417 RepID=A0AAV8XZN1_9CUCU|nr:hypothetical protein NQ318_006000 [Aromia moschata]